MRPPLPNGGLKTLHIIHSVIFCCNYFSIYILHSRKIHWHSYYFILQRYSKTKGIPHFPETLILKSLYPSSGSQSSSGQITPSRNEAPILFERKGTYYLMYGPICCFCHQGSGIEVWSASHPLGPWTDMNLDLNPNDFFTGREIKS